MLPTAQDMIYAMPSIQVNCSASWVGHRASPLRKVLKRRSTGSWKMRNGLITLPAEIISTIIQHNIDKMEVTQTKLKDCFILKPRIFEDNRGYFFESFNEDTFN